MKKEEELKKVLDEKDKWYKDQLGSLQNRVRLKSVCTTTVLRETVK